MKTFVDSISHWDHTFAAAIFGLNGRNVLAFSMPRVSHTGNGHISRSREVIRELRNLGHEVQVLLSGRKAAMPSDLKAFEPHDTFDG